MLQYSLVFAFFVILLRAVILRSTFYDPSNSKQFVPMTASNVDMFVASEKEIIQLNIHKFGSEICPGANAAILEEVIFDETVFYGTKFH